MERLMSIVALSSIVASVAGAQTVQTYTRGPEPSRSEGLRSLRPFIVAGDPRPGLLITPAPFPDNRIDGPDRAENGRLWYARGPIGNRTPVREQVFGRPGPGSFGAPAETIADVIWIQPEEITSVVAISPWQQIDAFTLKQIQRQEKNLGKTVDSPSSARLLSELRAAQHQWLQEQGYILNVRTHVNAAAASRTSEEAAVKPTSIQPRGVIRVVPQKPADKVAAAPTVEPPVSE